MSIAKAVQISLAFSCGGERKFSMTKRKALAIVFSAAVQYKTNLVGRSLLFLCMDKGKRFYTVEVTFDISNFKHLTGLKSSLPADQFYNKCLKKRLSINEFEFSNDGTTVWKLKILPAIITKNLNATMIGEYNGTQPLLYTEKVAGSISACIGFVHSGGSGRLVPNTLLNDDIRSLVARADRILVVYRKKRGEAKYHEIVGNTKSFDWSSVVLPTEYAYLPLPK